MNWLDRSILSKLVATIIGGSILIVAIATYNYFASTRNMERYEHLLHMDVNNERRINQLLAEFKVQVQEWKNVLLRGKDPESLSKYWNSFQKTESDIQDKATALANDLENEEARRILNEFIRTHQSMGAAYRDGYQQFVDSGFDPYTGDKAVKGIDRAPAENLAKAAEEIEQHLSAENQAIAASVRSQLQSGFVLTILAIILITAGIIVIANRSIVEPSKAIIKAIDRISTGILSDSISVHRDDEIGQLAGASRRLQGFLRHIAEKLNASNSQLTHSVNELTLSTEGVSGRVASAHKSTEHVASAMTEMSATSQEVARHAASAASLATDANQAAQEGLRTMNTAEHSINHLAKQVEETVATVKKLAQDTNNVGTVLSVIRGIAEQTNL